MNPFIKHSNYFLGAMVDAILKRAFRFFIFFIKFYNWSDSFVRVLYSNNTLFRQYATHKKTCILTTNENEVIKMCDLLCIVLLFRNHFSFVYLSSYTASQIL